MAKLLRWKTFAVKDSYNYFPVNTIVSSTVVVLTAYCMKAKWWKTCKNQVDKIYQWIKRWPSIVLVKAVHGESAVWFAIKSVW